MYPQMTQISQIKPKTGTNPYPQMTQIAQMGKT